MNNYNNFGWSQPAYNAPSTPRNSNVILVTGPMRSICGSSIGMKYTLRR